jgi:cell division protein FtsN
MKTILPWILVVAFGASAGALYFSNSNKTAELARAQEQVAQVDTLRGQVEELQKQAASQNDQIAAMQKDNQELLRLRNQVRQLTDEKAQLLKQMQMAQSQADRSAAQVQQVQAQTAQSANAIAEQRILQMKQNEAVLNTCINNLRMIDGAKQQWALEHQRTPDSVPSGPELAPYFPNNLIPQCPGGGRYSFNAVSNAPTCSIPGHVLH